MSDWLKLLYVPGGRVSRQQIWLQFQLPLIGSMMISNWMAGATTGSASAILALVVGLFWAWPGFNVQVKRLHDRDMSGWWLLLPALISIALVFMVIGGLAGSLMMFVASEGESGASPAVFLLGAAVLVQGGVSLWLFVVLMCLPGTDGPNRFGNAPGSSTLPHNSSPSRPATKEQTPSAAPVSAPKEVFVPEAISVPSPARRVEVRIIRHGSSGETTTSMLAPSGNMEGDRQVMLVGRSSHCDLTLEDDEVSRQHAVFYFDGSRLILADIGSTNGTSLNGTRCDEDESFEVRTGDAIVFGQTTIEVTNVAG